MPVAEEGFALAVGYALLWASRRDSCNVGFFTAVSDVLRAQGVTRMIWSPGPRPMAHGKVPAPTNSVSSGTWRRRLASRSGYGRVRMDKLGPFRSRARIGAGSAPPARPRRDASACAACKPSRSPGYPCHAVRPGLSGPRGAIARPNRLAGAQSVWLHGRILAGVPRLAERGRHPPRRRPRRRLSRALQRRAVGPFWRACAVDRR